MDRCRHCQHDVAPNASYCAACGQSRMLESLLAPRPRPAWQDMAWQTVTAVGLAWFLLVACVAFLREPKALRVARQAIELGQAEQIEQADSILNRFLTEHPRDEEGLLLSSRASARLEDLPRAAELRDRLRQEEPDLLEELDPDIGQVIGGSIRARACSPDTLLAYYDETDVLGDDFRGLVLADMQEAIRRCLLADDEGAGQMGSYFVMAGLVERKIDPKAVQETYLVPLRTALHEGHFDEAELLALAAASISPETGQAMDPALKHVRGQVEASIARVNEVCRAIAEAPESRKGTSRCFPSSPPSWTVTARDGWGRSLVYKPLKLNEKTSCYQEFEVATLGADGQVTEEDDHGPDADVTCRFNGRRQLLQEPSQIWRRQS